jgi:DedD protein
MTSSQDTEITLGTGELLVLFFSLVAVCALFFALGYSLGRKSDSGITTASAATSPHTVPGAIKPVGAASSAPVMTFYKAVEQRDASPELTPAVADDKAGSTAAATAAPTESSPANTTGSTPDPATTLPAAGYFVQVAAVSKEEDANALVDALKKKQYPAFVAGAVTTDKLFHVQVGPFADIKDAEAMRARLISDGYNPILKK